MSFRRPNVPMVDELAGPSMIGSGTFEDEDGLANGDRVGGAVEDVAFAGQVGGVIRGAGITGNTTCEGRAESW